MIVFEKHGNIFDTSLEALVCPVNTVGTLGKGLALQFRETYPGLLWPYKKACATGVFKTRGFFVWRAPDQRWVVCLPTKRHWSEDSRLPWIAEALERLAQHWQDYGFTSLAMPPIGCGEGNLSWRDVRPLIYQYFEDHPLQVGIYAPAQHK